MANGSKINILVVDDNESNLVALQSVLEELGENIVTAISGKRALRLMLDQEFALVLLDVNMPGLSGFEVASMMKQIERLRHIPIIFMTAMMGDSANIFKGYTAGAVDYIITPINPAFLRSKVTAFIQLQRLINEAKQFAEEHARLNKELLCEISLRNQSSRKLRETEAQAVGIINSAMDSIIAIDGSQRIMIFNPAAERMFRCWASEAIGQPIDRFIPERFRDLHREHIQNFGQSNVARRSMGELGYLHALRADGEEFPMEASISQVHLEAQKLFIIIIRDITERLRAEQEMEQYAKKLARSNADLEQFAYVASHDLQEPLREIHAFSDLLEKKFTSALDDEGRDYLQGMQSAAARMQALIADLLAYLGIATETRPFEPVDLNLIAREVTRDLQERIEQAGGQVILENLPIIEGDSLQMRQLFQILIVNALEYGKPQVPPVVKIYSKAKAEVDGSECELWIEDNGVGHDEEAVDRIFEPFERLHSRDEQEGTGMGLAICRKIVERHKGSITARSAAGKGAAFIVALPALSFTGQSIGGDQNNGDADSAGMVESSAGKLERIRQ